MVDFSVATTKKTGQQIFPHPLLLHCCWIRDPGWIKVRIRDPEETSRIRNTARF
jgi:hypothetical protein